VNQAPTLVVLNGTCLDVVDSQRAWIESLGVKLLAEQRYRSADAAEIRALCQQADAVILPASVRSAPLEADMIAAPRLKVCAIAASGFEWLDVAAATRHGIVVTNAPGGEGAEVVAEIAWGLMLAAARQIPHHHMLLSRGDMTRGAGTMVSGKTLGIIGIGAIGREVALRAKGWRMRVMAHDPWADVNFVREHGIELVDLDKLLRESDFVSLHVRLNEQTRGMIGPEQIAMMKPTTFLINTARKELVDEAALVEAILKKRLGGAGLDDPPGEAGKKLFGLPNVVFTTHLGNRAIEGMIAVFRAAVESAVTVLRGGRPKSVVNPEVYQSHALRLKQAQTA
jgi:phosphoglycerate dehydrogenase-like enzyme